MEVRGQNSPAGRARGANPATGESNKWHDMRDEHVLYSVLPRFVGFSSDNTHVTPLTTFAVGRCLSFNGAIAGVVGGVSAGLFGLCCQQTAEFFAINPVRSKRRTLMMMVLWTSS